MKIIRVSSPLWAFLDVVGIGSLEIAKGLSVTKAAVSFWRLGTRPTPPLMSAFLAHWGSVEVDKITQALENPETQAQYYGRALEPEEMEAEQARLDHARRLLAITRDYQARTIPAEDLEAVAKFVARPDIKERTAAKMPKSLIKQAKDETRARQGNRSLRKKTA